MTRLVYFRRTFLARRRSDGTTNDGPSSKKEVQVRDMNYPRSKGEQVDDMKNSQERGSNDEIYSTDDTLMWRV